MSMTESEAKNVLDNIWDFAMPEDDDKGDVLEMAVSEAIAALEEIQQYRAIGTVKVFETVIKSQMEYCNRMREYEKIGTVSEFRELKKKATAKKVRGISLTREGRVGNCPSCGSFVRNQEQTLYCDCGQHLDWSEGKEVPVEKIVDSLTHVDFSGIQIPMAVIYEKPKDHPGMYVCRIWEGVGCHPTDTAIKKASLEELQKDIQAAGFTMRFPRAEDDDPVILETWMR